MKNIEKICTYSIISVILFASFLMRMFVSLFLATIDLKLRIFICNK